MKKNLDGEMIDMDYVNGKNLSTAGYDEEKRFLAIEFTRGPAYIYENVPKSVYEGLAGSPSADGFFEDNIRHIYKNRRVC